MEQHIILFQKRPFNFPGTDVLTTHHYSPIDQTIKNILENEKITKNKKPYFIGEFGSVSVPGVKAVIDTVVKKESISGIMLWSLRSHNRDGGFYLHGENFNAGPYRYPGFESGEYFGEKEIMNFYAEKSL